MTRCDSMQCDALRCAVLRCVVTAHCFERENAKMDAETRHSRQHRQTGQGRAGKWIGSQQHVVLTLEKHRKRCMQSWFPSLKRQPPSHGHGHHAATCYMLGIIRACI